MRLNSKLKIPPRLTSVCGATAQAVRVLSVAQAVDEGSQLMHVVHFSSHHHLFVDHVGLRQVRSLLQVFEKKKKQQAF